MKKQLTIILILLSTIGLVGIFMWLEFSESAKKNNLIVYNAEQKEIEVKLVESVSTKLVPATVTFKDNTKSTF